MPSFANPAQALDGYTDQTQAAPPHGGGAACVAVCRRKLLALGPARNGPGDPPGCQQYERLRLGYASDIVHLTDRKT